MDSICGVLLLNGNKTFGKSGKRLLYRFVADDKTLPMFLVPYEMKLGFSKDIKNKYVIVRHDNTDVGEHSICILVETIGDVDCLSAYYEYRLYCRGVHDSISKFTQVVRQLPRRDSHTTPSTAACRSAREGVRGNRRFPLSIDPRGCVDIDDAFSIVMTDTGYEISVHIANVYAFMESHQLWDYIDTRVSTIYLPDKRRTMLPPMISENICSLLANQMRQVLTMKVTVDVNGLLLREPSFVTEEICVGTNYAYEEPSLLKNRHYQMLLGITRKMGKDISDSHDVVEYWMVYMNTKCGQLLASRKCGVFRTAVIDESDERGGMRNIIKDWNNTRCEYVAFDDTNAANLRHDLLGVDTYAQITSPIRRLVDLINQTLFIRAFLMGSSHDSEHPLMKWLGRMDVLNAKMKSIRKVQAECELVEKCCNERDFLRRTYLGVVFRKLDIKTYSVYVKEFRTFIKVVTTTELELYANIDVKMYYFADEHEGRRKVQGEPTM